VLRARAWRVRKHVIEFLKTSFAMPGVMPGAMPGQVSLCPAGYNSRVLSVILFPVLLSISCPEETFVYLILSRRKYAHLFHEGYNAFFLISSPVDCQYASFWTKEKLEDSRSYERSLNTCLNPRVFSAQA
jgi:hypothetical protein